MRSVHRKRATLILIGLALLLFSFSSFVHADAAPNLSAAAVTPTVAVYLPLVSKNTCGAAMPAPGDWLAYVNYYRALACLPAVAENAAYSDGDQKHARYMVRNDIVDHTESMVKPWYTPEGAAAGLASNVMGVQGPGSINYYTDEQGIDFWMRGPFHALAILDPKLLQTGFGTFREVGNNTIDDVQMAAALDVNRGLGSVPSSVTFPIKWPSDGTTVNLKSYDGIESPDPLTSCPGYTAPSGLPIILQLGAGNAVASGGPSPVTQFSLTEGATPRESCEFDENNYQNPDSNLQNIGQQVLNTRDAIVIVPRNPLTPGATYTVSVTANSQVYTWSFTVSVSATALEGEPEALIR